MDKSTRMGKTKSRLSHSQDVLKKAEAALSSAERTRNERFGDAEMRQNAKEAAEGLNLASLDELRSMKLQPPPVVEIVARCVCTLASGDDLGDAEYRAKEKAVREEAAKKAAAATAAKGQPKPKPREATARRRLLGWEDSQRVLSRANFKERIANFDGRVLLDNDDLVAEVRSRIDLSSIRPEQTMAQNLKRMPVRSERERNVEQANAQDRRALYSKAIASGDTASAPLITIDDARYVSKIAPPLLVWMARILKQHEMLEPAWRQMTLELRAATKKRDDALGQFRATKQKSDEAREEEARRKQKLKEEKERAEALGLQADDEKAEVDLKAGGRPTELTTPDKIVVSGPTPNIFFQNGRISQREGGLVSSRLQLPTAVRFFIRVKHCRVTFPFPPSISADRFLHTAQVIKGHEEAGPVAHVPFDPAHVIGLLDHQLLSFVQLVIEVPSTETVNPALHRTRICFHPRHGTQLHSASQSSRAGGAGTLEMPRLIVAVYPLAQARHSRPVGAPGSPDSKQSHANSPPLMASPPPKSASPHAKSASPQAKSASPPAKLASPPAKLASPPAKLASPQGKSASPHAKSASPPRKSASPQGKSQRKGSFTKTPSPPKTSPPSPLSPPSATVPPLPMEMVQSIGSAYRKPSKYGELVDGGGWARAAIALSDRARHKPYGLSKPGPARQIPDILLLAWQNSAVSVASARRLSRSSAQLGVEALKELSSLVGRACEGYVFSPAEKRHLKRAADLEAEVEKAERTPEQQAAAEVAAAAERKAKALAEAEALEASKARAKADAEWAAAAEEKARQEAQDARESSGRQRMAAQLAKASPEAITRSKTPPITSPLPLRPTGSGMIMAAPTSPMGAW